MLGIHTHVGKPIQLYHFNTSNITCDLVAPAPTLDGYVNYFWLMQVAAGPVDLEVIPDGALDLGLSPEIQEFAAIYLPAANRFTIPLEGPICYVGVCIKVEHSAKILGLNLADIAALSAGTDTRRVLHLDPLIEKLQVPFDLEQLAKILNEFFTYRLQRPPSRIKKSHNASSQQLLIALQQSLANQRLADVATHLGISERQFRRLAESQFGLAPKKLQRILRLQAALSEYFQSKSALSQDHFYDDSHKIREIRELTGLTPGEIKNMAELYNQSN